MPRRYRSLSEETLRAAYKRNTSLFWAAGVFSGAISLLALSGPLYMLNLYDRVLGGQSMETLIALSALLLFAYVIMSILDFLRGRLLARAGARLRDHLSEDIFRASLSASTRARAPEATDTALRQLSAIQHMIDSPALLCMFDLPWLPLYFGALFLFHPIMGWLAIAGAAVLIMAAVVNRWATAGALRRATVNTAHSEELARQIRTQSDLIHALGMGESVFDHWRHRRRLGARAAMLASDRAGATSAFSKGFRLLLQSAMLGVGAWLVLRGMMNAGAMMAASILLARALMPIDGIIAHWTTAQRAYNGWNSLKELLSAHDTRAPHTNLRTPKGALTADRLTIVPPGTSKPTLKSLSFTINPGEAVGVIGSSGAGKSSLAKAICGIWPPASGSITLDGTQISRLAAPVRGATLGYLPQDVALFDGTIAENIARMSPRPDEDATLAAAKTSGIDALIEALPDGYDTMVGPSSGVLSGGQVQRLGLARALYGNPMIVVLDEPSSNLDNEGALALNAAVAATKAAGGIVVVMAHRPTSIMNCDLLLVLEGGERKAFGPRDQVLRDMVQNHGSILAETARKGSA